MFKILILSLLSISSTLAGEIMIEKAYVRFMSPTAQTSAAFMKITNHNNTSISLVKAKSDVAKTVEIHNHVMEKGIMKMKEVPEIVISAHKTIELRPGSFHIMLIDLHKPLVKNSKVKMDLEFSDKTKKSVELLVTDDELEEEEHHHH